MSEQRPLLSGGIPSTGQGEPERRTIHTRGRDIVILSSDSSPFPIVQEEEEDEDSIQEENKSFTVSGHHIEEGHQLTTNTETLIHLIKGNIGTGILAMPDGLKNSGLYTGIILLPLIASICIHCMHILVICSNELKERTGMRNFDYADVAEQAFKTGPVSLRPFANTARRMVKIFLIITQMGFCCIYVVFIAANIKQVVDCQFPGSKIDIHGYMGIILLPLLLLAMIRSLKVLAPFSLISNILLIVGLGLCFFYLLQDLPSSRDAKEFASWQQLPLFFGTSIYAFEGIGVVLPLERNMANPEDFTGYNGVLNTAMVIVTCGYMAVGFFGYLKYGDNVHGSITLNLPPGDNLAQFAKVFMALAIYLTYSLMLYVPVQIMWPHLKHRFNTRRSRKIGEYTFRAFLVIITFVLAAIIPNIGLFISLVGAVSSSTLAMLFPPIIQIVTFWPTSSAWMIAKSSFIFSFGVICFITGTYASFDSIIDYFKHSDEPSLALVC